jgi:hypothetical protein
MDVITRYVNSHRDMMDDRKTKRILSHADESTSTTPRKMMNKQKLLIVASRGIISRYRYLMKDLLDLLPHSKKGEWY